MLKATANIISYFFHPLLMATYCCLVIFFALSNTIYYVFTPLKLKLILTITIFSFTFLMPVLNLLLLQKLKYISSLKIENQKERAFPLIATALCYFGLFYMLYDFNIWPAIKLLILGGGLCIFFVAIINFWWKISAHMIGIGGVLGLLLAISYSMQLPVFIPISICLLLAGLVGFSRLKLQAHTPSQVYVGFILGCFIQFSLFIIAQNITFV